VDPREGGQALQKMWALQYKGDIKAYLTSFRALNLLAKSSGEPLQDMINRALPLEILHMRFSRYTGIFTDDELFLDATYEAGKQVELEKSIVKSKEAPGSAPGSDSNRNSKEPGKMPKSQRKKENDDQPMPASESTGGVQASKRSVTKRWESIQIALQGVPENEVAEHKKSKDNCLRCGRPGHRCIACYAKTTVAGTTLPTAPDPAPVTAFVSSVSVSKRKPDNIQSTVPAKKQASAVNVGNTSGKTKEIPPIWEVDSEEEDFY